MLQPFLTNILVVLGQLQTKIQVFVLKLLHIGKKSIYLIYEIHLIDLLKQNRIKILRFVEIFKLP